MSKEFFQFSDKCVKNLQNGFNDLQKNMSKQEVHNLPISMIDGTLNINPTFFDTNEKLVYLLSTILPIGCKELQGIGKKLLIGD